MSMTKPSIRNGPSMESFLCRSLKVNKGGSGAEVLSCEKESAGTRQTTVNRIVKAFLIMMLHILRQSDMIRRTFSLSIGTAWPNTQFGAPKSEWQ